jgi:hypothetical protein
MGQTSSQPTTQLNPNMTTSVTNTSAKISPNLPKGPANFSSFQLPGTNSNSLNINVASLQKCLSENSNPTPSTINNCISNNISSYDNQASSYQNVIYVGPGHYVDASGNVAFGPFNSNIQNFQNVYELYHLNNKVYICILIVLVYLFIMLN